MNKIIIIVGVLRDGCDFPWACTDFTVQYLLEGWSMILTMNKYY